MIDEMELIFKQRTRTSSKQVKLIMRYIHKVWNQMQLDTLSQFLDADFIDYSIPIEKLRNQTGTKLYLAKLSESLSHQTKITGVAEYDDIVICQFQLFWYSGQESGIMRGRRIFRVKEGKILTHWEIFDE